MKVLMIKNKGFAIIEVLIVLAIASLILVVVFLAIPQLIRIRQDAQRKRDAGTYVAALVQYASEHGGEYPYTTNGLTILNNTGSTQWRTCWKTGVGINVECPTCKVNDAPFWISGFQDFWVDLLSKGASTTNVGLTPCGLPSSYFDLKGPGSDTAYFGVTPDSNGKTNRPALGTYYYVQGGTCNVNGRDWAGTPNSNSTSFAFEWALSNSYFCVSG